MTLARQQAVESYRERQRRRGLLRLEVQTPAEDAPLVRQLARTLRAGSERAEELRGALKKILSPAAAEGSLKQLLEAAPLDGIDFSRPRDLGRKVDL